MISDQQRGLRWQSLPTGRLKPEVVLAQDIPDRLLNPHRCLVGALEGVFSRSGDPLADEALIPPLPWRSARPGSGIAGGGAEMVATTALFLRRGEPHLLNRHSNARFDQQTGECAADNARHTLTVADYSKPSEDLRFGAS